MLFKGKICLDIEIIRFSLPSTNNDFYGIKVDTKTYNESFFFKLLSRETDRYVEIGDAQIDRAVTEL
jgi:hypothetical protein